MSEILDTESHSMHCFISDSKWNAHAVMDRVATCFSQLLPGRTLEGLLVNENGWAKKDDYGLGSGYPFSANGSKAAKLPSPLRPKESRVYTRVGNGIGSLAPANWQSMVFKCLVNKVSKALFHLRTLSISNTNTNSRENEQLELSERKNKNRERINYSLTNPFLRPHAEQILADTQAQLFVVGANSEEQNQIPGINPFQTPRFRPRHDLLAVTMISRCFMLKTIPLNRYETPILSSWDLENALFVKFYKKLAKGGLLKRRKDSHSNRQHQVDIWYS
jgi:hypothetical protein